MLTRALLNTQIINFEDQDPFYGKNFGEMISNAFNQEKSLIIARVKSRGNYSDSKL
jgi:hypothetical protein